MGGDAHYFQCGCCGNLYARDGSEDDMYDEDHRPATLWEAFRAGAAVGFVFSGLREIWG
jgi:hypothetical protein